MRAVIYEAYGPPDGLRMAEVARPVAGSGEVIVKVHAASVNSWDWDVLVGEPFLARIDSPRVPKNKILGADIAGVVAEVGVGVTRFQVGDEVIGELSSGGWGGFAEFARAREGELAKKPEEWSFVEAAAMPQAGLLALQALRNRGPLKMGDRILINGAGGGVGTFAIQLAKMIPGVDVTGVDRADKLETMTAAGADRVIDYAEQDFTRTCEQYDRIIDVVSRRGVGDYRRALKPNGQAVIVGGKTGSILNTVAFGGLSRMAGGKDVALLIFRGGGQAVAELASICVKAGLRPVIDRTYPLAETADAMRRIGGGEARGKLVVTPAD